VAWALERTTLSQEIDRYLRKCFRDETAPRVKEFAEKVGMPRWEISRLVKNLLGYSLRECFLRSQLKCAKRKLRTSLVSLNRIAYSCGFGTRNTFFRVFRRRTGMSPAQYRNSKK
jgi:AraC family transcriptional regulator of arabinose operon